MNNASEDIRSRGISSNYPGFDYPLQFCPMRPTHKEAMMRAMWVSHKELRGFIGWAKYLRSWSNNDFYTFVEHHINATPPNQHFVFLIGEEIVGVGSLVKAYTQQDAQIALWVTSGYKGKGIGQRMVETLEYVAFNVWGFHTLYYEHDSSNEASKRLPQKCGFKFSHTKNIVVDAENESGFWYSWKKYRPEDLPPAIIQGRPITEYIIP